MYSTNYVKEQNILEVKNSSGSVYGKIHLNDGASLQVLTLDTHEIIQDLAPLSYSEVYASSILFPFANRIKDGVYQFDGNTYQFDINHKDEQNALHGLVYNKTFTILDEGLSENNAKITLEYDEPNLSQGFPFPYKFQLEYTFTDNSVAVKATVFNTGKKRFPFTLGWHPYFISENLKESTLAFSSSEKVVLGERNITTGTEAIAKENKLQLHMVTLDDCWILDNDKVEFITPKYKLTFRATGDYNCLQAYIPPKKNTIAIEPTTGVSNSFNNNIGLRILNPQDTYDITWTLQIN